MNLLIFTYDIYLFVKKNVRISFRYSFSSYKKGEDEEEMGRSGKEKIRKTRERQKKAYTITITTNTRGKEIENPGLSNIIS